MLLEQAQPGTSLKHENTETKISVFKSMLEISNNNITTGFKSTKEFFSALDRVKSDKIPTQYLELAKQYRDELASTKRNLRLLHSDLHLDNILKHNGSWVLIDPKGVIGEPELEPFSFDFIEEKPHDTLRQRIDTFATELNLNPGRYFKYTFARLILSACWWVEDNGDPSKALGLAEKLYSLR